MMAIGRQVYWTRHGDLTVAEARQKHNFEFMDFGSVCVCVCAAFDYGICNDDEEIVVKLCVNRFGTENTSSHISAIGNAGAGVCVASSTRTHAATPHQHRRMDRMLSIGFIYSIH